MEHFNQQGSGWSQNWLCTSQVTKGLLFLLLLLLLQRFCLLLVLPLPIHTTKGTQEPTEGTQACTRAAGFRSAGLLLPPKQDLWTQFETDVPTLKHNLEPGIPDIGFFSQYPIFSYCPTLNLQFQYQYIQVFYTQTVRKKHNTYLLLWNTLRLILLWCFHWMDILTQNDFLNIKHVTK